MSLNSGRLEISFVGIILTSTGVMTKRDFAKKNYDQCLMSYNGMVYDKSQSEAYYSNWVYNTSRSDEERREAMKYTIGGADNIWQIPIDSDNVELFASYGPKVNHRFYSNQALYVSVEHPR